MKKVTLSARILAAATVGFSVITLAPAANAASLTSLVPQQETEIKTTNLGCLDVSKCIHTTTLPFGYEVTSLLYDTDGLSPEFGHSRLFVDKNGTENTYGLGIKFGANDAGTNTLIDEYWFRPVAMLTDGTPFEADSLGKGQLEVGKFLFDFGVKTVSSLTLDLFDVEDKDFTKILKVNGQTLNPEIIAAALANGKTQTITLYNVNSFEVQLGKPGPNSKFTNTGDGVRAQVSVSVPEPGTMISLGALAVAGMFGVRKGKKASQVG
ncbi:MAG: PEP-CTERM sorting domain-containing protein [Richelia sp. SM1_7_0]|nr:PEP-CTERM sorting domain-containing protein [Richelia sp. SM1_7_0]